ncbi:MAG: signal peptidase II [Bacilli bacterium]|nr:signal peptidase II [Bacilli bacterium]
MKKISLISLIVFIIDRITKILVSNTFTLNVRNKVIDKFFYITNCHNKGAAFSIFTGNILFLILITLIVIYLIYKTLKNKSNMSNITIISYGLLLGGIVGNLFDRIFYGYVIDFLDFIIFKFDFAVFNIADMAIVIGAFMLLVFEGSDKNANKSSSK